MRVKKENLGLIFIVFLAFFLRFFRIASVPPSLDWDEVAIGWNANTIFHTRRDEFGIRLPLTFMSFGDYKSPLYIYLAAPVVGIFGLNEFSVRFPSAFFGSLTVLLVHFLVKELFSLPIHQPRKLKKKPPRLSLALTASLLLAISPWHLQFSRPAFEPNLALFFIVLGTWLFLKAVNSHPFYFLISSLSYVLSFYSYHSPKIFLPIFFLGTAILWRKKLMKKFPWLVSALLLAVLLLYPLLKLHLKEQASSRFTGTAVFYNKEGEKTPFDLSLAKEVGANYLTHFSPKFLFLGSSDNFRIKLKEHGLLYLIEAPLLLIGVGTLIKQIRKKWAKFILFWGIIGPLPAAIAREAPHSLRAFNILPAIIIIIGLGIGVLRDNLWKFGKIRRWLFGFLFFGVYFLCLCQYLYQYHFRYPVYAAEAWQYGYKEMVRLVRPYEQEVEKIIITSHYGQPHVFVYFWQARRIEDVFWGGMSKYLYRDLNWVGDQFLSNVLLVGTGEEIPANNKVIKEIYFPDGRVAFRIVKL